MAVFAAVSTAIGVDLPPDLPGFALQAAPVYRLEVGAATFLGLYLVSMALVLALNNRGFSEIGMRGVKAADLSRGAEGRAFRRQEVSLHEMSEAIRELQKSEAD